MVVSLASIDLPIINLQEKVPSGSSNPPHTPSMTLDLEASLNPINLISELIAFIGMIGLSNAIPLKFSNLRNSSSHLSLRAGGITSSQPSVLFTVSLMRHLVPDNTGASRPLMSNTEAALEAQILLVSFGQNSPMSFRSA